MRITQTNLIQGIISSRPGSPDAKDLINWVNLARNSSWLAPADVTNTFPGPVDSGGGTWVFPLPRSALRIKALVGFRGAGQMVITEVR
jgi:mRNA-degrading endonuclease HigB of HigAB toxin-antitoxin module